MGHGKYTCRRQKLDLIIRHLQFLADHDLNNFCIILLLVLIIIKRKTIIMIIIVIIMICIYVFPISVPCPLNLLKFA